MTAQLLTAIQCLTTYQIKTVSKKDLDGCL